MPGIDSSIYAHFAQPVKSVQDYDNERMQGEQNKLALAMQQQKADEYTRGVESENRLRSAVSRFGEDRTANQKALYGAGALKEGEAYGKATADAQKMKLEQEKTALENGLQKMSVIAQIMSGVKDQASADAARLKIADLTGKPIDPSVPYVYDPAEIERARIQATPLLEQAKQRHGKVSEELAQHEFEYKQTNDKSNRDVQIRGQNVTAETAAARLNYDKSQPKGQIVQSDTGPILVDPRSGVGKSVLGQDGQPLAGITKPLNDSQSKALLFGTRMQEANKVLNDLASTGTSSSVPGSRSPVIGGLINAFSGEDQQSLDQAKRDFMTAVLRRESGASISPGEFDTADKQYFPQVGDSEKVKSQKARNRELAISGVLVEVPEKSRSSLTPKAAAGGTAKVSNSADYAKVPSGAEYITPDGHTRRKP
jgi:hypothetical protein